MRLAVLGLLCAAALLAQGPAFTHALSLGGHFPADETEDEAAAEVRAPIKPDSALYDKLVTSNNPQIIYDAVPAPNSTQIMNERLREKLNILAGKVQQKWGTPTKLRILAAYQEPPSNLNLSTTHNEGRAADITVNNFAAARLSELADLAVASGFDWVYYEDAEYIHVSVIPDRCSVQVDLAFALDGSGSVQSTNFNKALQFIQDVTKFFDIGVNKTRIALVVYATGVKTEFDFDKYDSRAAILQHLQGVRYPRGWTNTGGSLDRMRTDIYKEVNGMRPSSRGIPRVVVVMTDGRANIGTYPGTASDRLVAAADTSIVCMGIGPSVRRSELNRIATSNDNVFMLNSFSDMPSFINAISTVSCDEPAVVPPDGGVNVPVPPGEFVYLKPSCDDVQSNLIVEEFDATGESNLYVSYTNKNPGPLSHDFADTSDNPTKIIDVPRDSATQPIYISVQGGSGTSTIELRVWNDLFAGNHTYTLTLPESMTAGTEVFSPAPLKDSKYFKGWYPDLTYSLEGDTNGDFAVDPATGVVTLAKDLDHERVSGYSIKVKAQDKNYPCVVGRESLIVNVVDENDNVPIISPTTYTATINENAPIGQQLTQVLATDADSGNFGTLVYSLVAGSHPDGLFAVDSTNGKITVAASLVDLSTLVYTFQVNVFDSDTPPVASPQNPATVTITVERVFDQPPVFGQSSYLFFVAENVVPTNNLLGTLSATDADMGDELKFSIAADDAAAAASYGLSVVESTGEVLLLQALNHEVTPFVTFTAVVKDKGNLEATAEVRVTVADINEKPTAVKLVSAAGTEVTDPEVTEGAPGPVTLGTLVVTDPDDGDASTCQYFSRPAAGGVPSCPYDMATVSSSLQLSASGAALNFEAASACLFRIRCTDKGSNVINRDYVLTILDTNEAPFNAQYTGDLEVAENAAEDTKLGDFTANDPDFAEETLLFEIVRPATGQFRLGDKVCTGGSSPGAAGDSVLECSIPLLLGAVPLDHETQDSITVEVRIADDQSMGQTITRIFSVLDTNDAPTDIVYTGPTSVAENTPIDTVVGTFAAVDTDDGQTHTFALVNPSAYFSIVGNELRVAAALDFENIDPKARVLTVRTTDHGTAPVVAGGATFDKEFTITITNVNEAPVMAPVSLSPVPEDSPVGFSIGTVFCVDEDAGDTITYEITAGNTLNKFSLAPATGALTLNSMVNFEAQSAYALTVICKDAAGLSSSPAATLNIVVVDVNEAPSAITVDNTNIDETEGPGAAVLTLSVSDPDGGQTVTCAITTGADDFEFAAGSNRDVVLKRELDYDVDPSLVLGLTCTDDGTPALSSSGTFNIGVINKNEDLLSFVFVSPANGVVTISETVSLNTMLAKVRVADSDQDDTLSVAFAATSNTEGIFAVDTPLCAPTATAGTACEAEIRIVQAVDVLGVENVYPLLLEATDQGGNKRTLAMVVTIKGVNNPPTAITLTNPLDASAPVTVTENAVVGTVVAVISVADIDSEQGHTFELTSASGDASFFSVLGSNLVLAVSPNFEALASPTLQITLTATDSGVPPLSVTADFGIAVLDVDEPPVCVLSSTVGNIDENRKGVVDDGTAADGDTRLLMTCTDEDTPEQDLTTTVTEASDGAAAPFEMKQKGGGSNLRWELSSTEKLDYEATTQYVLTIAVADASNTIELSVTVNINNLNDNKPKFNLGRAFARMALTTPAGTEVAELTVEDSDGPDGLTLSITDGNDYGIFGIDGDQLVVVREPREAYGLRRAASDLDTVLLQLEVSDGSSTDKATFETVLYIGCPLTECGLAGYEDYVCVPEDVAGGTTAAPDGSECECPFGYSGPTCETNTDDCFANACENGGTCIDGLGTYTCECVTEKIKGRFYPKFVGSFCEIDATRCPPFADVDQCRPGGSCVPSWPGVDDKGFVCECDANFGGDYCTELIFLGSSNGGSSNPLSGSTGAIAGGVIGGVALAVLFILLIVFVVIRRRQRADNLAAVKALQQGGGGDGDAANTDHMFANPAMVGELGEADGLNPLWCPPEEDGHADFLTLKEHYATGLLVDKVFDEIVATRELWLQDKMSRKAAEMRLAGREPGAFVVRDSETVPGAYVLSVVTKDGKVRHELIFDNEDEGMLQLQIEGLDNPLYGVADDEAMQPGFPTMEHLITHYARNTQPGVDFQLTYSGPEYEELVARAQAPGFHYEDARLLRSKSSRRYGSRRKSGRGAVRSSFHRLRESLRKKQGRAGEAGLSTGHAYDSVMTKDGYLAPDAPYGYAQPSAGYDEPGPSYALANEGTDTYIVPSRDPAEYASCEPTYTLGQESDGSVALYAVGDYDEEEQRRRKKADDVLYASLPRPRKGGRGSVEIYSGGEDQYMDGSYLAQPMYAMGEYMDSGALNQPIYARGDDQYIDSSALAAGGEAIYAMGSGEDEYIDSSTLTGRGNSKDSKDSKDRRGEVIYDAVGRDAGEEEELYDNMAEEENVYDPGTVPEITLRNRRQTMFRDDDEDEDEEEEEVLSAASRRNTIFGDEDLYDAATAIGAVGTGAGRKSITLRRDSDLDMAAAINEYADED